MPLGLIGGDFSIRADLRNLLLCEKGGSIKPHSEKRRVKGLIATLVTILQSDHDGDEVTVQSGSQNQSLSGLASKEFVFHMWIGTLNVDYSVKPVTLGDLRCS